MKLSELIIALQTYPDPEQEVTIVSMTESLCMELEFIKVIPMDRSNDPNVSVAVMVHPIGLGYHEEINKEKMH